MELIYLYVRTYKGILSDIALNFSPNFNVSFSNNILHVDRCENKTANYYGDKIKSTTLLFGKNGMGKSTILDLLGMNRYDRLEDIKDEEDKENGAVSYFILYHIIDDYFAFEFVDHSFLDGEAKIQNLVLGNKSVDSIFYHEVMGTIFLYEKDNDRWQYINNILLKSLIENSYRDEANKNVDTVAPQLAEYHYILTDRNGTRAKTYRDNEDYILARQYYYNKGAYVYEYDYFSLLNSADTHMTENDYCITVKNVAEVSEVINDNVQPKLLKLFRKAVDDVNKLLLIVKDYEKPILQHYSVDFTTFDGQNNKENFLYYFYAKAAVYYFFEEFIQKGSILDLEAEKAKKQVAAKEKNSKNPNNPKHPSEKTSSEKIPFEELSTEAKEASEEMPDEPDEIADELAEELTDKEIEAFIAKLESDKLDFLSGNFEDSEIFQVEVSLFKYAIKHYKLSGNVDGARKLLTYALGRFRQRTMLEFSIEPFLQELEVFANKIAELPETCFINSSEIRIPCNGKHDDQNEANNHHNEAIRDFLKLYRNLELFDTRFIRNVLTLTMPTVSHGQEVYIGVMARIASSVYGKGENYTVILLLDEPDQSLHPEMARNFMKNMIDFINKISHCYVQIVMTSHSPFIVTDILPEGVYRFESSDDGTKDGEEDTKKIFTSRPEATYATNIYSMLLDPFMLKSTFGAYAKCKIEEIIELLKSDEKIDIEREEYILEIIERIGEPVLKNKLRALFDARNNKN